MKYFAERGDGSVASKDFQALVDQAADPVEILQIAPRPGAIELLIEDVVGVAPNPRVEDDQVGFEILEPRRTQG